MLKILLLHGPNLNLLGSRETSLYGNETLDIINSRLQEQASNLGIHLDTKQTNAEHVLIELIQSAVNDINLIIINAAGFTHTSVALRDALLATKIPFIEVHISNIHARESYRDKSLLSDLAAGIITGFGSLSYELALHAATKLTFDHKE